MELGEALELNVPKSECEAPTVVSTLTPTPIPIYLKVVNALKVGSIPTPTTNPIGNCNAICPKKAIFLSAFRNGPQASSIDEVGSLVNSTIPAQIPISRRGYTANAT